MSVLHPLAAVTAAGLKEMSSVEPAANASWPFITGQPEKCPLRLRKEAERKPDSKLYARLVAECEAAVRAEIIELAHAVLANQQPQGSA